ncbi:MAG: TIGR00366 family protein [Flavobacteriales bacterium]|nr:TIGR00366 family protein [Flavobacteriales bacterium]
MSFTERYTKVFKALLPAPFTIAVILTIVTFFLALFFTKPVTEGFGSYSFRLLTSWEKGLGGGAGLAFAVQMMLMLVLGHSLALTKPIDKLLTKATNICTTTAKSAFIVTFLTIIFSLFNWGLGLIFGALFARKIAENAKTKKLAIHYPLIGAAGYSGLMVWHGGLSGSAPLKIAEVNGMSKLFENSQLQPEFLAKLPSNVPFSETVLSPMNLTISVALILLLPLTMYLIGKRIKPTPINIDVTAPLPKKNHSIEGAEKLDYSKILGLTFGIGIVIYAVLKVFITDDKLSWSFISPNYINLLLFGLALILHSNFSQFLKSIDNAIGGAAGILIQFPLYFGILGLMKDSGMMTDISNFFVAHSTHITHPIYTFFSAGIVNILVPSGGGQWAVQGPIIIESSIQQGLPLGKEIMAMSYGDQLTNMLQPFWALPLLAITGLRAKDILPYTLFLMIVGTIIFITGLMLF